MGRDGAGSVRFVRRRRNPAPRLSPVHLFKASIWHYSSTVFSYSSSAPPHTPTPRPMTGEDIYLLHTKTSLEARKQATNPLLVSAA